MADQESGKADTRNQKAKEYYTKGGELFENNQFEEAISYYTKAIEEDQKYSSAYFNRALAYAIINKYDEARRDVDYVLRIEPNSHDAPYVLGIISEYQQDYKGAKEWYEESLKKNPDYEQAKQRLEQLKNKMKVTSTATETPISQAKTQENETVTQEGQLKKVKWFTSETKFKDVMGMEQQKKAIYENIILAIRKPELLKAYGKKLGVGVLFYGPPGNGKCVSGDTDVLLPDGRYVKIRDVVENREEYVMTLTEKHKLVASKVSGWWKLKGKPMLRITTDRGRIVECTPEHPFLTKDGWREASTFKELDIIGVPRRVPIFGNDVMRESEVKLLAYFIAEGGLAQGSPKFTNSDPEMLEDFVSATKQFDEQLHVNTIIQNGRVANLQVAGRYAGSSGHQERSSMQRFLDLNGLSFTSPYDKKIPSCVFTLQKRLVALFLNRLFSGDGWFENRVVKGDLYGDKAHRIVGYSSNSGILIRQVQHLLLRFGILSSIRKMTEDNWELLVYRGRDVDIFIDEIGMFGSKASFLFKKKNSWSKIKKKGGNRVVYEAIRKIENVEAPDFVYDLTVEGTHNFIANDFFVHNTYLVRAIAGETNSKMIIAHVNEIVDMYAGNTEKNLHQIFEQARKNTPCIIFFDEIEALGGKRDGGGGGGDGGQNFMKMAVNQFLQEMDGVEKNPEGIFVIGATNMPWDMDSALKRSGRFGQSIYVPPPDYKARKSAFGFAIRKMPVTNINLGRLARATIGFSQADISDIADQAALKVAAEEDRTGRKRKITTGDMLAKIRTHGNTLDEWYGMIAKEIISKKEVQIVDGKKTEVVKEGKLSAEEKIKYRDLVGDVKKNNNQINKILKKIVRLWSWYIF
jgi:SpoVK/Ycf46/Vps4 family AAA+-type ATPase